MKYLKILFLCLLLSIVTVRKTSLISESYSIDNKRIKSTVMTSGGTFTVTSTSSNQIIKLTGTPTLTGNYSIVGDGNETEGMSIVIMNAATPVLSGGHIYLFGVAMPDDIAAKNWTASCTATATPGTWIIEFLPSFNQSAIIDSSRIESRMVTKNKIANYAVDTLKMADLAGGYIYKGNPSKRPIAYNAATAGYLLGGTGSDLLSMTTDTTTGHIKCTYLSSKLLFRVVANAITSTQIAATAIGSGLTGAGGSAIAVLPDATNGTSISVSANGTRLTNDVTSPGINMVYSTNSVGVKGWNLISGTSHETTLSIDSAGVSKLFSAPLQIIAPPGAGKAIEVEMATMSLTYASVAWATNTTLWVITETAEVPHLLGTVYLGATKSVHNKLILSSASGKTQLIANKGVNIFVTGGNPATGNSPIKIYVKYRIITL